jgi:hypothetical protein
MKFVSGEKLKNIIMYFQIFVTILFMGGMQIGSRFISKNMLSGIEIPDKWYSFLFPPVFFGGFIDGITSLNFDSRHLIFIAESILLPIITVFYTTKYLTPLLNKKLIELGQGEHKVKVKSRGKRSSLLLRFSSFIFTHNNQEKASFHLIWHMIGRERLFKQTFFPSVGIMMVVMITQLSNRHINLDFYKQGDSYLFLLYLTAVVSISLIGALQIGNSSAAVWIIKSLPVQSPAEVFKASIKAAFSRFFMPFYMIVGAILIYICGIRILPDLIIVILLIYLLTCALYYFQELNYPFTMSKETLKSGGRQFKIILLMFLLVPLGYFHRFLIHLFSFGNLLLIPIYAYLSYFLNTKIVYRRITWKSVKE